MVITQSVELHAIALELGEEIVMVYVNGVVLVEVLDELIPTVGTELVPVLKNPPNAKYNVEASITVIATSNIVAMMGLTASSRSFTSFRPLIRVISTNT